MTMENLFSDTIDYGIGLRIRRERMHLTAQQGDMVYFAFHYFCFVSVYFLFWLSCR